MCNSVTVKFIMAICVCVYTRYVMIPANRGKENNEQGMALRGTGGSGKMYSVLNSNLSKQLFHASLTG